MSKKNTWPKSLKKVRKWEGTKIFFSLFIDYKEPNYVLHYNVIIVAGK
jgi:hypothetical protein